MTRINRAPATGFVPITLIVLLLASYLNFGLQGFTYGVSCNHQLNSGGSGDTGTVYQITSTNALLCLNYSKGSLDLWSFYSFNLPPWFQNGSEVNEGNAPCPIVSDAYCPGFTMASSPKSVTYENSTQDFAVVYTIRTLPNASGLYVFFLIPGNPIYLSFGQPPSSVYLTAWTSGPRLPAGQLQPSYNMTAGTNIQITSVPWA